MPTTAPVTIPLNCPACGQAVTLWFEPEVQSGRASIEPGRGSLSAIRQGQQLRYPWWLRADRLASRRSAVG